MRRPERRRVIAELFATGRLLAQITINIRALIESGALADEEAVAAAEQLIERNRELAERLDATAESLGAP